MNIFSYLFLIARTTRILYFLVGNNNFLEFIIDFFLLLIAYVYNFNYRGDGKSKQINK